MSKRCAFLENCVAILGLKNVTVLNSEVEKAPSGAFDIVVFRAFRPLDLEMTRSLLALTREPKDGAPAGKLAAWKARRDKIEIEMNAIADGVDGWRVAETPVPFLDHEERHLVIISSTQNRCRPR
jgi:16S rRNA (guanine527-N7)-methyltransferase